MEYRIILQTPDPSDGFWTVQVARGGEEGSYIVESTDLDELHTLAQGVRRLTDRDGDLTRCSRR